MNERNWDIKMLTDAQTVAELSSWTLAAASFRGSARACL